MNLYSSGEDSLIDKLTSILRQRDEIIIGPGDDCAVLPLNASDHLLLKTDAVVEGIHFLPEEAPERIGWKAAARVVSDIAAMGGTPQAFVVTIALRGDTSLEWTQRLYQGIQHCADQFHFSIVGGETTRMPHGSAQLISIAATGSVPQHQLTLRSTAQLGDFIYVTGQLGGSISGKHLDFTPRIDEAHWLTSHFHPTAMMDLSDGLAKDLPRLARLSNLGYHIDLEKVPCSPGHSTDAALHDGEDYELLFTQSPTHCTKMEKEWHAAFPTLPLTCIGIITSQTDHPLSGGWDHFHRPT